MAKKKKTDELLEQDDALESPETLDTDTSTDEDSEADDASEDNVETPAENSESAPNLTSASEDAPTPVSILALHSHLEKAARSLAASGTQTGAHALNKLAILIGSVKLTLPEAIAATDDVALKADLAQLLGML